MNIEEILDDMDDLLDRSRPIPFGAHKAVIDADRMRELLNSAHLNIPAEIKRAKLIDSDCDRIMNEARQKAEAIIQDAETRAKRMLSEQAILQEAKKRALDMLTKAQNGSMISRMRQRSTWRICWKRHRIISRMVCRKFSKQKTRLTD